MTTTRRKTASMNVRLDPEQNASVERFAAARGLAFSEAVRRLLDAGLWAPVQRIATPEAGELSMSGGAIAQELRCSTRAHLEAIAAAIDRDAWDDDVPANWLEHAVGLLDEYGALVVLATPEEAQRVRAAADDVDDAA